MAARLLLLFIIAPIVELFLLVKIGGIIGVVPTIALVLLTAIIGSQLVRRQGMGVMNRIREAQAHGEAPAVPMLDGAALLLAGFFLLTPGFISDALGFLLLIPKLRQRLARAMLSRFVILTPGNGGFGRGPFGGADDGTIEGEYQRKSDRSDRPGPDNRLDRDD
ncbi:FxsA family protein [Salinisphaera hydrothermalis]|uniref:Exclusion suppressor FxsA n=1 Tax=Salinisphaera hydrothermalis (strain C41B8) TaxID=1304275 RepID=A0A084ILT0_SALHC|nr:FxsA family protein [Salinisphaera hydrothermalis]KEZ77664.1 exclusion suppressor FxsA [Salinisphaera hydrothermalis C41B8]